MGKLSSWICLVAVVAAVVAVAAVAQEADPEEVLVYPLVEEDGGWWVGLQDMCTAIGAEYEGEGIVQEINQGDGRLMVVVRAVAGTGPMGSTIIIGEDEYKLTANDVAVEVNGEHEFDCVHVPKRINGVPSIALEDFAMIAKLTLEPMDDGAPMVVTEDGRKLLLTEGEPKPGFPAMMNVGGVAKAMGEIKVMAGGAGLLDLPALAGPGGMMQWRLGGVGGNNDELANRLEGLPERLTELQAALEGLKKTKGAEDAIADLLEQLEGLPEEIQKLRDDLQADPMQNLKVWMDGDDLEVKIDGAEDEPAGGDEPADGEEANE